MVPDQPDPEELVPNQAPSVGARVDLEKKAALKLYQSDQNRKRTAAEGTLAESQVIRDAIDLWLAENWDRLPQEARDLLDEDLLANAGAGEEVVDA